MPSCLKNTPVGPESCELTSNDFLSYVAVETSQAVKRLDAYILPLPIMNILVPPSLKNTPVGSDSRELTSNDFLSYVAVETSHAVPREYW